MLSVPPERLEQFSLELKQNIKSKKSKKSKDYHKHSKGKRSDKKYRKNEKSISSKSNRSKSASSKKRKSSGDLSSRRKKKKSKSDVENLTDDSDMEENGLDLTKELHPLSHYVKDRQVLSDILFIIVKGAKLAAMLPDILKNMSLDVLKQKCFSHLEVMSSKRIIHILTGEPMHSSSGTESEEEHNSVSQNNEAVAKGQDTKQNQTKKADENILQTNFVDSTTSSGCEVLSLLAAGSEERNGNVEKRTLQNNFYSKLCTKEIAGKSSSEKIEEPASSTSSEAHSEEIGLQEEPSDIEEEIETVEIVEDEEYADMVDAMLEERLAPADDCDSIAENTSKALEIIDKKKESGLSQLELLELQLRARAIKSLMKAANNDSVEKI